MAAEEGKRGAQRKEASRHVTAPALPPIGGAAERHLHISIGGEVARCARRLLGVVVLEVQSPGSARRRQPKPSGSKRVAAPPTWAHPWPQRRAPWRTLLHTRVLSVGSPSQPAEQLLRAAGQKGLFGRRRHCGTQPSPPAPAGAALGAGRGSNRGAGVTEALLPPRPRLSARSHAAPAGRERAERSTRGRGETPAGFQRPRHPRAQRRERRTAHIRLTSLPGL